MFKHVLFLITTTLVLTGCVPNVKQDTITYKTIPTTPPDTLLIKCEITKPGVSKEEYIALTTDAKEAALTDLTISLYGDLKACNKQLEGIRNWKKNILDKYSQ